MRLEDISLEDPTTKLPLSGSLDYFLLNNPLYIEIKNVRFIAGKLLLLRLVPFYFKKILKTLLKIQEIQKYELFFIPLKLTDRAQTFCGTSRNSR